MNLLFPFFIQLFLLTGFSALLNFLLLKWTRTLGAKNLGTEEVRWSSSYKPAIGGVSFYTVFLISCLLYLFFKPEPKPGEIYHSYHLAIVSVATIGFFIGLADDAFNTVPWLKFSAQLLCGILLVLFDLRIEFFHISWMDSLLTVFWTVAVMNSLNMLDNMDAITATVSVFILLCAISCAMPITGRNMFYIFISGGVMAALLGFLFFNWNPSKIFMGDTGSQMLGALLAAIGILFFWNNGQVVTQHTWWAKLTIVTTAFVIPIGDSLTVTINRMRRGQSPFVGGRDHTTHHLSYAGLSDRQVAYVMISISGISYMFIAMLPHINAATMNVYLFSSSLFAVGVIVFLYSTTLWKRSRAVFKAKHMQSA